MKRNVKGQAVLEMLLLCLIVLGTWLGVSKALQKRGAFDAVFGKPWARLSNVIEFGVPTDKTNNGQIHPAHAERHSTRID